MGIRPLAKVLFARGGKREKVKGERENTKPFPLSPSPFPDLCKKSIGNYLLVGVFAIVAFPISKFGTFILVGKNVNW
ncbi:hypothetical protein H6H01_14450 [Nostoc calcicola FACHB-3891]|nr:hypothetical protein [Nostoc calcicola FACHB-3891]